MNPYVTPAVAQAIMADRLASAEAYRRAKAARQSRPSRKTLTNRVNGWRHHRVELVWPDGVRSQIELPRHAAPAEDHKRGLAGTRR